MAALFRALHVLISSFFITEYGETTLRIVCDGVTSGYKTPWPPYRARCSSPATASLPAAASSSLYLYTARWWCLFGCVGLIIHILFGIHIEGCGRKETYICISISMCLCVRTVFYRTYIYKTKTWWIQLLCSAICFLRLFSNFFLARLHISFYWLLHILVRHLFILFFVYYCASLFAFHIVDVYFHFERESWETLIPVSPSFSLYAE